MKITYEFVTGERLTVEADDRITCVLEESRRQEENAERKHRYHAELSMDSVGPDKTDAFSTPNLPEQNLLEEELTADVQKAFSQLTAVQQRRLLLLASGLSIREIARKENADYKSVRESIISGRKKFLNSYPIKTPSKSPSI